MEQIKVRVSILFFPVFCCFFLPPVTAVINTQLLKHCYYYYGTKKNYCETVCQTLELGHMFHVIYAAFATFTRKMIRISSHQALMVSQQNNSFVRLITVAFLLH